MPPVTKSSKSLAIHNKGTSPTMPVKSNECCVKSTKPSPLTCKLSSMPNNHSALSYKKFTATKSSRLSSPSKDVSSPLQCKPTSFLNKPSSVFCKPSIKPGKSSISCKSLPVPYKPSATPIKTSTTTVFSPISLKSFSVPNEISRVCKQSLASNKKSISKLSRSHSVAAICNSENDKFNRPCNRPSEPSERSLQQGMHSIIPNMKWSTAYCKSKELEEVSVYKNNSLKSFCEHCRKSTKYSSDPGIDSSNCSISSVCSSSSSRSLESTMHKIPSTKSSIRASRSLTDVCESCQVSLSGAPNSSAKYCTDSSKKESPPNLSACPVINSKDSVAESLSNCDSYLRHKLISLEYRANSSRTITQSSSSTNSSKASTDASTSNTDYFTCSTNFISTSHEYSRYNSNSSVTSTDSFRTSGNSFKSSIESSKPDTISTMSDECLKLETFSQSGIVRDCSNPNTDSEAHRNVSEKKKYFFKEKEDSSKVSKSSSKNCKSSSKNSKSSSKNSKSSSKNSKESPEIVRGLSKLKINMESSKVKESTQGIFSDASSIETNLVQCDKSSSKDTKNSSSTLNLATFTAHRKPAWILPKFPDIKESSSRDCTHSFSDSVPKSQGLLSFQTNPGTPLTTSLYPESSSSNLKGDLFKSFLTTLFTIPTSNISLLAPDSCLNSATPSFLYSSSQEFLHNLSAHYSKSRSKAKDFGTDTPSFKLHSEVNIDLSESAYALKCNTYDFEHNIDASEVCKFSPQSDVTSPEHRSNSIEPRTKLWRGSTFVLNAEAPEFKPIASMGSSNFIEPGTKLWRETIVLDAEAPEFKPIASMGKDANILDAGAPEFMPIASKCEKGKILLDANAPEFIPAALKCKVNKTALNAEAREFRPASNWQSNQTDLVTDSSELKLESEHSKVAITESDTDSTECYIVREPAVPNSKMGTTVVCADFIESRHVAPTYTRNTVLDAAAPEFCPANSGYKANSKILDAETAEFTPVAQKSRKDAYMLITNDPALAESDPTLKGKESVLNPSASVFTPTVSVLNPYAPVFNPDSSSVGGDVLCEKVNVSRERLDVSRERLDVSRERLKVSRERLNVLRNKLQESRERLNISETMTKVAHEMPCDSRLNISLEKTDVRRSRANFSEFTTSTQERNDECNFDVLRTYSDQSVPDFCDTMCSSNVTQEAVNLVHSANNQIPAVTLTDSGWTKVYQQEPTKNNQTEVQNFQSLPNTESSISTGSEVYSRNDQSCQPTSGLEIKSNNDSPPNSRDSPQLEFHRNQNFESNSAPMIVLLNNSPPRTRDVPPLYSHFDGRSRTTGGPLILPHNNAPPPVRGAPELQPQRNLRFQPSRIPITTIHNTSLPHTGNRPQHQFHADLTYQPTDGPRAPNYNDSPHTRDVRELQPHNGQSFQPNIIPVMAPHASPHFTRDVRQLQSHRNTSFEPTIGFRAPLQNNAPCHSRELSKVASHGGQRFQTNSGSVIPSQNKASSRAETVPKLQSLDQRNHPNSDPMIHSQNNALSYARNEPQFLFYGDQRCLLNDTTMIPQNPAYCHALSVPKLSSHGDSRNQPNSDPRIQPQNKAQSHARDVPQLPSHDEQRFQPNRDPTILPQNNSPRNTYIRQLQSHSEQRFQPYTGPMNPTYYNAPFYTQNFPPLQSHNYQRYQCTGTPSNNPFINFLPTQDVPRPHSQTPPPNFS